jgi:hypothetical protein
MGKRVAIGIVLVFVIGTCVGAATPHWIGDRIVDKIMNWGDKHDLAPFKKGGGDEAATRKILTDLIVKVKPWAAVRDVFVGSESNTASKEQDRPGHSQEYDGAQMPSGARTQIPIVQPAPPYSDGPSPRQSRLPHFFDRERGIARGQGGAGATTPAPSAQVNSNPGGGANTQAPNQQQTLTLYKNKEGYVTTTNPNPPAAPVQAVAQPAPQPASRPAPTPSTQSHPEGRTEPMNGAHEINHGSDKPDHNTPGGRDVGGVS